jgi:hypothetical protein
MSDTTFPFSEEREIAEMKLWSAVIANTIREWIHGSARLQREAEEFLLYDEDDFPTVCSSAGMNPETLRDRLKILRARADSLARTHFAKLISGQCRTEHMKPDRGQPTQGQSRTFALPTSK